MAQAHALDPSTLAAPEPRRIGASLAYWVPTALVAFGAVLGGAYDASRAGAAMEVFRHLGYPDYFATLLGTAKILGGLAIVLPVPKTLREWAYAGLVFDTLAAVVSIASVGDPLGQACAPLVFTALTLISLAMWRRRSAA